MGADVSSAPQPADASGAPQMALSLVATTPEAAVTQTQLQNNTGKLAPQAQTQIQLKGAGASGAPQMGADVSIAPQPADASGAPQSLVAATPEAAVTQAQLQSNLSKMPAADAAAAADQLAAMPQGPVTVQTQVGHA
jgi:hypothetical protein